MKNNFKTKGGPASRRQANASRGGYTIIETMIAISLFIIIVMAGMGALLNANLLHQKSQSMRSIMDSMSFVMEDMSKNLRTGYSFQCFDAGQQTLSPGTLGSPRSCATGWAIAFEYADGDPSSFADQWVYYIGVNPIDPRKYSIFKSDNGANNFVQLTPDEVAINPASSFSVLGAEGVATDHQQPFVSIRLFGTITFKDVPTPFSLQTSVSQRLIDI